MIAAIVLAVTAELLAYAFKVLTSKFLITTRFILRITKLALVATVTTIIIMIAQPITIQTSSVIAGELILGTGSWSRTMMQSHVLISPVNAVRISVAQPFLWNALGAVPHFVRGASEFRFFVAFSIV